MQRIATYTLLILLSGFISNTFAGKCALCNQTESPIELIQYLLPLWIQTICNQCQLKIQQSRQHLLQIIKKTAQESKNEIEDVSPAYFDHIIRACDKLSKETGQKTTDYLSDEISKELVDFIDEDDISARLAQASQSTQLHNHHRYADSKVVGYLAELTSVLGLSFDIAMIRTVCWQGAVLHLMDCQEDPQLQEHDLYSVMAKGLYWVLQKADEKSKMPDYQRKFIKQLYRQLPKKRDVSETETPPEDHSPTDMETNRLNNNIQQLQTQIDTADNTTYHDGQDDPLATDMAHSFASSAVFVFSTSHKNSNYIAVIKRQKNNTIMYYWVSSLGQLVIPFYSQEIWPTIQQIKNYFDKLDKKTRSSLMLYRDEMPILAVYIPFTLSQMLLLYNALLNGKLTYQYILKILLINQSFLLCLNCFRWIINRQYFPES